MCTAAATIAPTTAAARYNHASANLPVATMGPSARAGLKGAPVRAPPMRMLKVRVIPIARGAKLPARPATAVLSQEEGKYRLDNEARFRRNRQGHAPECQVLCERRRAESRRGAAQDDAQQQRAGESITLD